MKSHGITIIRMSQPFEEIKIDTDKMLAGTQARIAGYLKESLRKETRQGQRYSKMVKYLHLIFISCSLIDT